MKFFLMLILGGFWVLTLAPPVEAYDLIELLPNGHVNWTRGVLVVKGCEASPDTVAGAESKSLSANTAAQNLLDSLNFVRMDARHSITDLIARNPELQDKIAQMVAAAPVVNQVRGEKGCIETAVQFQLTGGFAQLMLPGTIEQVRSIKPINGAAEGAESEIGPPRGQPAADDQDIYTGLIVDARGIGARPSMVPVIVDENHQEVYSPAFVSREFAVRQGVCGYARNAQADFTPRVGSRPLLVKGLRTLDGRLSDIMISHTDASRVRGASPHLRFLRQCRVMIIMD